MQRQPAIRKAADKSEYKFTLINFDLENLPPLVRLSEPYKRKVTKQSVAYNSEMPLLLSKSERNINEREEKRKEYDITSGTAEVTKRTDSGVRKAPAAEDAGDPLPSMIDLRVGHIIDGRWC